MPQAGDDVKFWEGYSGSCPDFRGPLDGGDYRSVTLGPSYAGTVTVAAGFRTQALIVQSGTIDQPTSGTDITVGGTIYSYTEDGGVTFDWTGGTINSTPTRPA